MTIERSQNRKLQMALDITRRVEAILNTFNGESKSQRKQQSRAQGQLDRYGCVRFYRVRIRPSRCDGHDIHNPSFVPALLRLCIFHVAAIEIEVFFSAI